MGGVWPRRSLGYVQGWPFLGSASAQSVRSGLAMSRLAMSGLVVLAGLVVFAAVLSGRVFWLFHFVEFDPMHWKLVG